MGYMGLESVFDSDMASDCAHDAIEAMVDSLSESLKDETNEFNTSGPENVALFFEEVLLPNAPTWILGYPKIVDLATKTKEKIDELITATKSADAADWDNEENRQYHVKAYSRMAKSIENFLKQQHN